MRRRSFALLPLAVLLALLILAAPAFAAPLLPPWDGNPFSQGIGPTYGESWPVPVPVDEYAASLQAGGDLAIIPYAAIVPLLDRFLDEAGAAGLPDRMSYYAMGQTAGGRDMYAVVINDLETAAQRRDFARWQRIREIELTDPARAQAMLAEYGDQVKIPIYIEANINGTEVEGTDAVMQAIRDLTTTPYGANETIDKFLDHAILIFNPTQNPDGRVMGIRGNAAVADTNRDNFLQSQPEEQNSIKLEHEWLETAGLDMHGYYTPTLIDGLTIPHNPGYQYDIFGKWNQLRTAQNKIDFNAMGYQIQVPVNDWVVGGPAYTGHSTEISIANNGATELGTTVTITTRQAHSLNVGDTVIVAGVGAFVGGYNGTFTVTGVPSATQFTYEAAPGLLSPQSGGSVWTEAYGIGTVPGPAEAQGWDDWGPFYGQTYEAFIGVDSSTVEMTHVTRLAAKTAQYMAYYSSVNFWLDNRQAMLHDQLEMFRRGVANEQPDPHAIDNSEVLSGLGFTDALHNWMTDYPDAYMIPFGAGQRSNAEANRLVDWLLANGVQVQRATADFEWDGATYAAGSYVVPMAQAMRGIAWNCLAAGTDIEDRIDDLYASPAAWSHGLLWGADTVEVPYGDATFAPATELVTTTNGLTGGVRGGIDAPSGFYAVAPKGWHEDLAILDLLRNGVPAEIAEEPFTSTTGGEMPAGTLIFPADHATALKLDDAAKAAGMWVERNAGVAMPATTMVPDAPKVAILANSVPTVTVGGTTYFRGADTDGCLTRLFGDDAAYVPVTTGPDSLVSAPTNPLLKYDVIFNAGSNWPANATAQARLTAFFARGGGYIGTSVSSSAFSFLNGAGLLNGTLTQGSQSAFGGIAMWDNVGGAASPLTGAYPSSDFMFLPSNITYFSATPADAVVDADYPATISQVGPQNGFIAGMWLDRDAAIDNAPVLIHGDTTAGSRYVAYATNPFSRYDAEREWPIIVQAALWADQVDEGDVAFTISASAGDDGMISPSGDSLIALSGNQAYTITPDEGYEIADVKVDGSSVGAVSRYSFDDVVIGHTIEASFVDETAPTVKNDAPTGWVNHDVTVALSASDDGSGVKSVEYKLDGGAWTTGTSVPIAAPKDRSNDGPHTIAYRATDVAGNVSAEQSCTVQIDTGKPTATAQSNVTVRKGARATLSFKLSDADPSCGTATVKVKITRDGKVVKTLTYNSVTRGTQSRTFTVSLKKGTYRWTATATDAAGNVQAKATVSKTFKVN